MDEKQLENVVTVIYSSYYKNCNQVADVFKGIIWGNFCWVTGFEIGILYELMCIIWNNTLVCQREASLC